MVEINIKITLKNTLEEWGGVYVGVEATLYMAGLNNFPEYLMCPGSAQSISAHNSKQFFFAIIKFHTPIIRQRLHHPPRANTGTMPHQTAQGKCSS